ncbi:MAG: precorrin-6y C5,15-methyltransferase (decarboxylating) subunit CbiE [Oscillospiraceae bacterium]
MKRNIFLIGTGMGCPASLTAEGQQAIAQCSVLIGAPRLLAPYEDSGKTLKSLVPAQEIADYIALQPADAVVGVLLSGDVGFYSGAKGLYPLLEDCAVVTLPGVSSLVYFCAKLHTTWQDAALVSAHGRSHNAPGVIQSHGKTFVLTGGENRAQDLCKALVSRGLGTVQIHVGENLSYPQERVTSGTAAELAEGDFDSLAVLLAENPAPVLREYSAPGIPDEAFLRGDAPMTKEEVRCLAISKLRLRADSVLWDVGAGTGSVSIEGALAAIEGQVFAVEKKPEALALLQQNKERFGVSNLQIVAGEAPAALENLPAPDRVFLGGTSGELGDILHLVFAKNPAARVVASAITIETLAQAVQTFEGLCLADIEVVQVAISKAKPVGRYHMMAAQNPIWLIVGEGRA